MRRFAVLIAAVGGLLASQVGVAAAAGCPNEAFRIGPGAALPECRAYEMVSPLDKNGGNIGRVLQVKVAPFGAAATFYSAAAFAGSPSASLSTGYIAKRGATGWTTEALDPPYRGNGNSGLMTTVASSPELGLSLSTSNLAIAPGAIQGGSNLYLRDNATGKTTLAFATPSIALFNQATGLSGGLFFGATPDWSHILIRSTQPLTADTPAAENEWLYDLTGGSLHLLNYKTDGSVEEAGPMYPVHGYAPYASPVSADGRRVFLQVGFAGEGGVLMRVDDERTIPLSVPAEAGKTEPEPAILEFANRAGTQAYFTSFAPLTPGAPTGSLYRYDVATDSLTNLTPTSESGPATVERMLGASPDGSNVYFLAAGALAAGATPAGFLESNVYAVHDGVTHYLGRVEGGLPAWQTSPDGRYLAFSAFGDPTGEATTSPNCPNLTPEYENAAEHCMDVYVYDSAADKLSCATCSAGPTRFHAKLGGQEAREPSIEQGAEFARAITDDGTVFFETQSKLSPRDLNGVQDAYSWRAGTASLVSTGLDPNPSFFSTVSPDGSDALFLTSQSLVGGDTDGSVDLYDARVGGGLASQWPPGAAPPCVGEGCRSASPAAPPRLRSGSAAAASGACAETAALERAKRTEARKLGSRARTLAKRRSHATGKRAVALGKRVKKLRHRAAVGRRAAVRIQNQVKTCGENH